MTAEILTPAAWDVLRIETDAGPLVRRYKCRVCGKVTSGRMSSGGADETGWIPWYPRKHGTCHGAELKAIYVLVPPPKKKTRKPKPGRRSA